MVYIVDFINKNKKEAIELKPKSETKKEKI
jgi:hypothetical protein